MNNYVVLQTLITKQRHLNWNHFFLTPLVIAEDDEEMLMDERLAVFEMDMTALELCDYENHPSMGGVPEFYESTMNTIYDMCCITAVRSELP